MNHSDLEKSQSLIRRAERSIPGGVNSPVRAFKAVGGIPRFVRSARGARLYDVDGTAYIDYLGSWGPMILGHAHPEVVSAIKKAAERGTSFGAPTELEVELAETICRLVPSIEKVRLVNSGTEATMTALRLARSHSGRDLFIKFDGCYHGHADSFLVEAGSGIATLSLPDSPGVPETSTAHTLSLPYGDLEPVRRAFRERSGEIAAIIVEPVAGNMGVIVPPREFLSGLIRLADEEGALVIFDEVMTGFRLALGGAQELFNLRPHLTCLGKIVGGGLPIGAVGGRAQIMDQLAPAGATYQAGTLSGNPLATSAGLKTLELLEKEPPYLTLAESCSELIGEIVARSARRGIALQGQHIGSMFTLYFRAEPVANFRDAKQSNLRQFASFFHKMLEKGVYLAPSQFEACFLSTAHLSEEIEFTVRAASEALDELTEATD